MRKFNFLAPVLLTAALTILPNLNAATTVMVAGVGSTAQYKETAVGAFLNLAGGLGSGHHYTIKGTTSTGNNYGQMHDSRASGIANQGGQLWIVWNNAQTEVWAYLSVDSVVGQRGFFAQPRTQFQLDPSICGTSSTVNCAGTGAPVGGQNLIAANLYGGQADDLFIPSAIYTALNNHAFTAGFTDVRPEDAKFENCRVLAPLEAVDYTGLGYGTEALTSCSTAAGQIGTLIVSQVTAGATSSQPVSFNISGTDPFTGIPIPKYTTVPIGAAPIMFVENISDTTAGGLGAPGALHNVTLASIQAVYTTGAHCDTNTLAGVSPSKPLTVFNREPLSGTFTTTEFTNFRLTGNHHTKTMEYGINPALPNNNPLDLACGIGTRERGIGTGEVIKGVLNTPNSISFTFFSYANIQPLAGSANFRYVTVQGIDPIYSTYTTGQLPVCNEPCPIAPGKSFPNVRNGTYRTWSLLRAATDASGVNYTRTKQLIAAAQAHVNETDPDFVPFLPQADGDPGLQVYRSHFQEPAFVGTVGGPSNGLPNGVGTENGGDVGGCIEPNGAAPGVLGCRQ